MIGAVQLARAADVCHTGVLTRIALAEFPPLHARYSLPLRGQGLPVAAVASGG